MQAFSLETPDIARSLAVSTLTLAAVALLAVVLAHWTWISLAPSAQPRAQAMAPTGVRIDVSRHLFGMVPARGGVAAATGIAIRLLGLVTATAGRRGYAMVRLEPTGVLVVREGDEVIPGLRLVAVAGDHVILERDGVRETLAWDRTPAEPPSVAPAATP